jgi:hypothetical protein
MPNISGKYNFNTRVGNTPECVFLYKKLQDMTRAFNYQTDIKTYQLSHIVGGVNDGRPHYAVVELPDNTGDYDSVSDAKNRKRTEKKKDAPCVAPDAGDDGSSAEDRRGITVLWTIRHNSYITPTGLIGKLAGWCGATSGHPYYTEAELMALVPNPLVKATYAFYNNPYLWDQVAYEGYKPYLPVDKAVFCHDIPANVGGQVSYRLNVQWNRAAFRPKRNQAYDALFYGNPFGAADLPSPYENWADFFEGYDVAPVTAELTAIHQPVAGNETFSTINGCGSDSLDAWWLYDYSSGDKQTVYVRGINDINDDTADDEFICWSGRIADYGAWIAYMNTMLEFWGVLDNDRAELKLVVSMAGNVVGGSCVIGGAGSGYAPDPTPPITPLIGSATLHGRYCDIFVNYQKNGIVRELKLPIDFPTRVTHVSYSENNFYDTSYPRESPGQRIETPYFAEWFSGRVNIDKNNIYVDIIYEIYREYEEGKKIFPNGPSSGLSSNSHNTWPERPGIISRWNAINRNSQGSLTGIDSSTGSDEDYLACLLEQNTEQVFARPTRDKFNKTVRYTIDKNSFSIINTQTFTGNHQETDNLFTDNFLKKNTILDISGLAGYRRYNSSGSMPNSEPPTPIVLNTSANHQGFVGLPKPYFQVSCNPYNFSVTNQWIEPPFSFNPLWDDYSCLVANDFLTLKSNWDDIYWLFYLMMEQPYIDRTKPTTPIQFNQRCQLKGAGYKANTNKYYLSYRETNEGLAKGLGVAPGFFDLYIEHERMRGYPVVKDGKITRWLRISPDSFPLFEPGGI